LRDEPVAVSDAVLDLADRFADAPIIDRTDSGTATERWRALVRDAQAPEAAVDG
jgi:hypothetical protein